MRFFVLALIAGCATATYVVQQYPGPARPPETIATVRVNGSDAIRVLTLDGDDVAAPLASDARLHLEVLPARHSLTAQSANERTAPLSFEAQAGKVYRVADLSGSMRIFEVDRGSDAIVRDVTLGERTE